MIEKPKDPEIAAIGDIMCLLNQFDREVSERIIGYVTDWNKHRFAKLDAMKTNDGATP